MTGARFPEGHGAFVSALEEKGPGLDVIDAAAPRDLGVSVSAVRRRRGRLTDNLETGFRDIALVERDDVLLWLPISEIDATGGLRRGGRRGRRGRRLGSLPGARVLKEVSVPVLEPNEYTANLRHTDEYLNADCDMRLRVVKAVRQSGVVTFEPTKDGLKEKFSGKTLVIVHGTFSSAKNSLNEYAATPYGTKFLSDAIDKYKGQVLVFDHPTLSVSPFINGIDLARALAGTTGELDVIAHSRGGVVVRWWLELFGDTLPNATVRAVLAGSPLKGTSLASPSRLHPFLNVLSNIGSFVTKTLGIAAAANPFSLASFALLKFVVRREKRRWGFPPTDLGDRPGVDAAVAVIPGLQGQSAVVNNYELDRLRSSAARANVRYFAITADFEPELIGWKLWKVITEFGARSEDALADKVFPAENDLVVDTAHMTSLDDARTITDVQSFGSQSKVHHCNYFRQEETITKMREWLKIP